MQTPEEAPPGTYGNQTSEVTATVDGLAVTGELASADLQIASLLLTKSFLEEAAVAGGTTTLEFTLSNVSSTAAATDITFAGDLDAPW